MWCSSKTPIVCILSLVLGAMLAVFVTGCMSDPAEGDLPWARQELWEGSPALPPGMQQQR